MRTAPITGALSGLMRRACYGAACLLLVGLPGSSSAQGFTTRPGVPLAMGQEADVPRAPLLTIERDQLYRDSAFGRRLQAELLAASRILAEENRRIEGELSARELELTEQREGMPLDEFRILADTFDARVTRIRAEQDLKARALQRRRDLEQQSFFAAALPVLAEIVQEAGAVAILDRSSVFLTSEEIDVTTLAIRRMDAVLGDGRQLVPSVPDAADRPVPRPDATDPTQSPDTAPGTATQD